MKQMQFVMVVILLCTLTTASRGQQDTLYTEYFTNGETSLNWFCPWTDLDSIQVVYMEGNPSGDNWVGETNNLLTGGGVGTALSGVATMSNYEVQAQIYCTVNTGSYHAVAARWDTTGGVNSFYYFRSDFDADQRLQLRKFPAGGMGETIAEWVGGAIPGGVPTQDSWHHMALKCEGNQLWVYWDGVELSGCPYTDDEYTNGFFGVYLFNMMSIASTYCDDIIVIGEAGPQPFDLIAQENHFLDQFGQPMILRPAENQTIYFSLDWDALNGVATSPPFDVTLELDNVEIYRITIPGVEPNSSHTTNSNPWVALLGEHTYRWTVDADNVIPEGNEDNNILEETFLVLPESAYDFQADSAWVADTDTIPLSTDPVAGEDVLFVLHWSVPMGSGPSGAFYILMNLDDVGFFIEPITSVESGNTYMTATIPWTAEEGYHYYEWFIDPDNMVEEFNENNNTLLGGFDVVVPTLLVTMEPQNPPIVIPASGGMFNFTAGVENVSPVIQTFDFWIMTDLPNGMPFGPILLRENISLAAAGSVSRLISQQVPAGAPSGTYYYYGIAGDYPNDIVATEGFNFTKESGSDYGGVYNDWNINGWEETVASGQQIQEDVSIDIRPNPFNPITQVEFTLPQSSVVEIRIYDIHGRQIAVLHDGFLANGFHAITWNGANQASGVYLLNLRTPEGSVTEKLLLLK